MHEQLAHDTQLQEGVITTTTQLLNHETPPSGQLHAGLPMGKRKFLSIKYVHRYSEAKFGTFFYGPPGKCTKPSTSNSNHPMWQ